MRLFYSAFMAKRNIKVVVRGQELFSHDDCDVCIKNACILVHNGDPLFAYAMMPGEYAKFAHGPEGVKVQVDS